MASVNARAEEYKESGAFGDTPMDVLRAYAYLDLINGLPAAGRIAAAEPQDDAADAAEALARAQAQAARADARARGRPRGRRAAPRRRRSARPRERRTPPTDADPDPGPERRPATRTTARRRCDGSCLAGDTT